MDKKLGLKVKVNGNPVTNAGFDKEDYVLVGDITFVERNDGSKGFTLGVGGLDSEQNDHVYWYRLK